MSKKVRTLQSKIQNLKSKIGKWLTWPRVTVILLTGLGLLLRRYHINAQSFWFDEADIVARAQADLGTLLTSFTNAGENGPLYTLILHLWMRLFGQSEATTRALSAIFGTLTIPLLYLFTSTLLQANAARRRWAQSVGVLAAAVLTVAPFHIWYSQEAKMYTLVVFATLLSMYAFTRALTYNRTADWGFYVVTTLLALYAHGMAVLILLAQLGYYAYLLISHRRTIASSRNWLRAILLLLLPFVPILIIRADYLLRTPEISQFYQPTTFADILQAVIVKFSLNRLPAGWQGWELAGGFIFSVLALLGLISLWRERNLSATDGSSPAATLSAISPFALMLGYLFVPILGFWLITLRAPLFEPRYLIIALPAWVVLVALGIAAPLQGIADKVATLPDIWKKLATAPVKPLPPQPHNPQLKTRNSKLKIAPLFAVLLVASISGSALASINFISVPTKEDWRGAMLYVKTHMREGDVIIVYPGYLKTAADYYLQNGPGPASLPNVPSYGIEPRIVMSGTMRDLDNTFSTIINGKRRAWLVQSPARVKLEDPRGSVKWWLDGNYLEDDARFYNGVSVYGINFNGVVGSYYPRPQTLMGYKFSNPTNGDNITLLGFNYEPRGQTWLPPSPRSDFEQGRCTFTDLDAGKCQAADVTIPRADYFPLVLYWRIDDTQLKGDYTVTLSYVDKAGNALRDAAGEPLAFTAPPLNGYLPTSQWPRLTTYMDYRDLWVAGDQPPGLYAIRLQLAPTTSPQQPLTAIDGDGNNVGDAPTLTRIVRVQQ